VWPAAIHERDITRRVRTLQISREKEHQRNVSNESYQFQENAPDLSDPSAGGDSSDSFLAVLVVISYCKRVLIDSPVVRACTPIIGQQNVDQLLRICIRDMRVNLILSLAGGQVKTYNPSNSPKFEGIELLSLCCNYRENILFFRQCMEQHTKRTRVKR